MNSFWDRFADTADRLPEHPAIIVQGLESIATTDYRTLAVQAEAAAASLVQAGIAPGDRCAVLGENSPAWVIAYLGAMRLGAVAVPIDRTYSAIEVEALVRDSGAVALFCSPAYAETGAAVGAACGPSFQVLEMRADGASDVDRAILPPHVGSLQDTALILYTSGTTADPKGVVLTNGNLLAALDGMSTVLHLSERDSSLGALPLFHILAQIATLLLPFAVGASVVQLEQINAGEVLRAMRERRITILCSVPQFFYLIHDRIAQEIGGLSPVKRGIVRSLVRLSGLARNRAGVNIGRGVFGKIHDLCGPDVRYFVSAGAAFDPNVARRLYHFGFDIIQAYGLTETTGAATVTPPEDARIGTVGKPLPAVSIAIRGPNGEACGPGEEGEIAIRGPIVTPGYYGRPEATAQVFDDGWFLSGDLGFLDADGHLHISGRSKDVIVLSSGKNIYPEEIERHLERSRFIKEACVVGLQLPDRSMSESLHAVVVPDMDAARQHRIVNLQEYVRNEVETLTVQLPPHKRVLGFDLRIEELPRTTTRKIKRFLVQQQLRESAGRGDVITASARNWTADDRAWADDPAVDSLLSIIRSQSPVKPDAIHPDDNLELDLGFDSLARIELIVSIEHALGTRLDEAVRVTCYTVRDLTTAALRAAPAFGAVAAATGGIAWPKVLDDTSSERPALPRGTGVLLDGFRFGALKLIDATARLGVKLDVQGLDHLPKQGAFIIASNHQSYLDGFLLLGALPYGVIRRLVMLGKTRIFRRRGGPWFADRFNVAVVDADSNLVQAMRVSAQALREGRPLLLFPEGERSIDGEIKPLRRGAAILACHTGAPIVPIVLDGPYEIWPRGRKIQRLAPVKIRVLPPLIPATAAGSDNERFDDRVATTTAALQNGMEEALRSLRNAATE